MDALRKIVLIACLLAIAISILDMLYPSEKFNKQVHLIFSLIFLLGITAPIISGKIQLDIPKVDDFKESTTYTDMQDNVNAQYKTTVEQNINKALTEKLSKNQINIKEISTKVNIADNNSISISEVEIACNSLVDNEKILNLIKSEVGQEVNVVVKQGEK